MMKKILRSPITTIALFLIAAALILTGTIGGVKAAPLLRADRYYEASMELSQLGLAITEDGTAVAEGGELFSTLKEDFKIGKTYTDPLAVINTSAYTGSYIRVTVYKYWTDENGKDVTLDPNLINLHFVEGGGWTIAENESTEERTVLYYGSPVAAGAPTTPFADTLTIDGRVSTLISADKTYDYDGVQFHVDVVADGVQEHNGEAAMTSAWGHTNAVG